MVGIGPDTAVALLITVGDNPHGWTAKRPSPRCAGSAPSSVPRDTGRYRLNRRSDRQANAALHRIVFTRLQADPRTQDFYERSIKEGKTRREIVECLKRHVVREVFHLIRPTSSPPPS
ncbi:transposase [Streptomyces sp. NPDC049627]|uniref:transposase n=1 Tax=Streptomyces sp. NPDC049627 TaxID=3365595 RepID=UPI003799E18D